MRIRNTSWAFAYSFFEIIQGLLVHPYQTMRQLVRERVFAWMVFAPVFLWIVALVIWKILDFLFFFLIPFPGFWLFLALWFTIGIGLYQILLGYLLIRFRAIL